MHRCSRGIQTVVPNRLLERRCWVRGSGKPEPRGGKVSGLHGCPVQRGSGPGTAEHTMMLRSRRGATLLILHGAGQEGGSPVSWGECVQVLASAAQERCEPVMGTALEDLVKNGVCAQVFWLERSTEIFRGKHCLSPHRCPAWISEGRNVGKGDRNSKARSTYYF